MVEIVTSRVEGSSSSTPYPLGRHVEHDPRSRNFTFAAPLRLADVSITWAINASALDQGQLSSCTGNAAAQWANCAMYAPLRRKLNKNRYLVESQAVEFYSSATLRDNFAGSYPPDDNGSSGVGVAKALQAAGWIDRYTHTFSFSAFRAALQTQPVLVGTIWTNDMFNPDAKGVVHVGDTSDKNVAGGHEYLAHGINYVTKRIRFRNSWGAGWGLKGDFYMSFDDFQSLLAQQGDATVPHGVGMP